MTAGSDPGLVDRGDRLALWCWAVGTFGSATSLLFYLPMSTLPLAEALSEQPIALVLVWSACLAASGAGAWHGFRSPTVFAPSLRGVMLTGTGLGLVVVGLSLSYIYYYSDQLPGFERAPAVGELAPEFSVRTPEGRVWSLAEKPLRGRTILLVFYRGNW